MFKKILSILMLNFALAIMLGHNFIPHHHHDFEHNEVAHHHNDGHHHDNDFDNEEEDDDWGHLFSGIQHGADGLTFLISHSSTDNYSKQTPQFTTIQLSDFVFNHKIVEVSHNVPPYISDYYNSQNLLPFGLRGPPFFIV
jgi:hypothetical protein